MSGLLAMPCPVAPADCWAHERGWGGRPGASVPAVYCWHGVIFRCTYPLCAECAARWRSYRDPRRLHDLPSGGQVYIGPGPDGPWEHIGQIAEPPRDHRVTGGQEPGTGGRAP